MGRVLCKPSWLCGRSVVAAIIFGRAGDVSDLTEPSEAGRHHADGTGQARRAEPVQVCTLQGLPARVRLAYLKI
jgi:hypothetical protein